MHRNLEKATAHGSSDLQERIIRKTVGPIRLTLPASVGAFSFMNDCEQARPTREKGCRLSDIR